MTTNWSTGRVQRVTTSTVGGPSRAEPAAVCLVGGTGRSGTTILKQIFARHPLVFATRPEWRFLVDPDGLVDFYDTFSAGWSPYVFDQRVRRLRSLLEAISAGPSALELSTPRSSGGERVGPPWRQALVRGARGAKARAGNDMRLLRLRPRYAATNLASAYSGMTDAVDALLDELIEFEFDGRWAGTPQYQPSTIIYGPPRSPTDLASILGGFFQSVVDGMATEHAASHVVEDSPLNLTSFDRISQLVPQARLVHIYRDPRDVVASYVVKRWGPSDPVQSASVVSGIVSTWLRIRASLPQGSFIEVSLEQLVSSPEETLRQICSFWELPWDDSLLATDLSRANSGRWRTELPKDAADRVGQVLAPVLDEYGYI